MCFIASGYRANTLTRFIGPFRSYENLLTNKLEIFIFKYHTQRTHISELRDWNLGRDVWAPFSGY